ncbi:MAG: 4-(cytidine 5'-diphospho)-2-C-methyl-D-erythritol kinase [Bacillota bacterium]
MPGLQFIHAYAKVNLSLDVLGRRADGYHELLGVMRRIDLNDEVYLEERNGVFVDCDVPLPPDNSAFRAASAYARRAGVPGASIRIKKGIPAEAGLGAASADAAAVLTLMQRLYGAMDEAALFEIGCEIGADVPFCLLGGTAFAEGIGEKLTPLPAPPMAFVVAKGERGIRTGELFSRLRLPALHPDHGAMKRALERGDLAAIGANMQNALEPTAALSCPEIGEHKRRLLEEGALGACMTGSGSAVVGLFETKEKAARAANALADIAFCRVCEGM